MAARILLVEDHPEVCQRIVEILSAGAEPFDVTAVGTCHAALEHLRLRGADCVLLDCRLPDAEGLEALHRVRAAHPEVKVIVMTAEGSEETAVAAMKAGAADYVVKHGAFPPKLVVAAREVLASSALAQANARVASGLCVGRAPELERLRNALTELTELSRGRVVLIGGEAGLGKSTLALHLTDDAKRRGYVVVWGRCHETAGAPPYWPWIQALRALEREMTDTAPAGRLVADLAALAELLRGASERPAPELLTGDTDAARFRLFDAVASALSGAARHRPVVVVIDDLHDADPPSVLLLRFLAREIADARVLVVATHREADGVARAWFVETLAPVRRLPNCLGLTLRGLSEAAVGELLNAIAGHEVSAEFARAFFLRTEGNPFFVTEIARYLVDEGILYWDGQYWTTRSTPEELPVPHGVREVIRRRLAHVSPECRAALSIAAVFGRTFDRAAVARLAAPPAGVDPLAEAVHAQAVVVLPGAPEALRFTHPLIRETLYDDLPVARRVALHRGVAELLAALPRGERAARVAELAYHFCEAAPGGDVERAVTYARQAADDAAAAMAHEVAARHYEMALRALRLAGVDDEAQRGGLLLLLGEALWRAGEFERARQAAAQAVELARRGGAAEALARAVLCFAAPLQGFGAVLCDAGVVALLDEALQRLDPRDSPLRAALLARLAEELSIAPQADRRTELAGEAIAMARRLDDPVVLGAVLRSTHWALWVPEAAPQRLELADDLAQLAERADDPVLRLDAQLFRVWALFETGGVAETRLALDRAAHLTGGLRQDYYRWLLATTRVCWAFAEGRLERVEPLVQEALARGEAARNENVVLFAGVQESHRLWLSGQFDVLAAALHGFAERYPLLTPSVQCGLAVTASERGHDHEARHLFAQLAAHDFTDLPRNVTWLTNLAALAEVCAALHDARRAAQLYALLRRFDGRAVALPPIVVWASAAYYLGLLAATMERWDDAARHFEAGLTTDTAMGRRHWVARGQLAYAAVLARKADLRERALSLLDEAIATSRELGMPALLQRAEALRATTAAARPGAAAPAAAGAQRVFTFRRDGEVWTIGEGEHLVRFKELVGMTRIQYLLQNPDVYFSAIDLMRLGDNGHCPPPPQADGAPLLDGQAKRDLLRRLNEIDAELDEATADNDLGRGERLGAEREALLDTLRDSTGLGQRDRGFQPDVDRARQAMRKCVTDVVNKLDAELPALASHLNRQVRTGKDCAYLSDKVHPIDWRF